MVRVCGVVVGVGRCYLPGWARWWGRVEEVRLAGDDVARPSRMPPGRALSTAGRRPGGLTHVLERSSARERQLPGQPENDPRSQALRRTTTGYRRERGASVRRVVGRPAVNPSVFAPGPPHSHRNPRTWSRLLLLGRLKARPRHNSASETVQPQTGDPTAGARSNRRQAIQLGAGGPNPWTKGRPALVRVPRPRTCWGGRSPATLHSPRARSTTPRWSCNTPGSCSTWRQGERHHHTLKPEEPH